MNVGVVEGDLLDQHADVIANVWNRNIIPRWLLPQGVSGAIKKRGGYTPFRELRKHRTIPLGGCRLNLSRKATVQSDHPCRRDQHAVAGLGTVDP